MHDKYLEFSKNIAQEAGKIIKQNFAIGMTKEWKSDNTPVTETDFKINRMLIEEVSKKFIGHGVMGEEESKHQNNEYIWVCDPLDGTIPFSHGLPISTFSLSLTQNGKPIIGVVYDPFLDRMFYATEGNGAFLNDKPIHVSSKNSLNNALVDVAHNFAKDAPINLEGFESKLYDAGAQSTNMWSIILPSALVAAGEYTATVFSWPKPVDGAAVSIIVKEAGGKFTDLFGNQQKYNQPIKGFVASNGLVHEQLIEIVKKTAEENAHTRH